MDMDIQLPTATAMTLPMVMAREMLRLDTDMVVMVMARDLLSQVMDMAVVTLMSNSPALTIMVLMVTTSTTPMARDPLSQVMDTDMALPTVTNRCPDHTPTMVSMFTIHTKHARLSERDCTFMCLDTSKVYNSIC